MEEKEILFTDSEIEHLRHICQQALANDPTAENAQSILQKITTAQHVPDLTSVEAATTHVPRRGRPPKVHPATAEVIPEPSTETQLTSLPSASIEEVVKDFQLIETATSNNDLNLNESHTTIRDVNNLRFNFFQNLLQKFRIAIRA